MMKKLTALIVSVLLILSLFTACGANSIAQSAPAMKGDYMVEEMAMEAPAAMMDSAANSLSATGNTTASALPENRKWIITVHMDAETENLEELLLSLDEKITGMGGYVSNREDYGYNNRETMLTLRIPSTHYADFIDGLPGIANVTRLVQSSQDITESYIETESSLASLTTQQDRLLELMAQAENLEDLLAIEDRLATVRAQLQYYASLKNSYDNRLTYSTVTLTLWEVKDYTVVQPTFLEKLWDRIKDSGEDFVEFLEGLLFFLIAAFPYLVLLGGAALLIRRATLKRRAKKAAAAAQAALNASAAAAEDSAK